MFSKTYPGYLQRAKGKLSNFVVKRVKISARSWKIPKLNFLSRVFTLCEAPLYFR